MATALEEIENREILKCKKDPIYFLETYGIVEVTKGTAPFKLFDFQKEYLKVLMGHKYTIVDKPRQMGFSLVTAGFLLWKCIFNSNKKAAVVSQTDRDALVFLSRAKFLYDNMPKWLVGNLNKENEHKIEFDNGSSIASIPGNKKSGSLRGFTLNIACLDEFAFVPFPESLLKSSIPALQVLGENLIILSTPNGTEGQGATYYNLLQEAKEKLNDFHYFETNWWENPLYNTINPPNFVDWHNNEWAMAQCKRMGEISFRTEILKEFLVSGETVIPGEYIDKLLVSMPIRTDFLREVDVTPEDVYGFKDGYDEKFNYIKGLWIFKDPIPGHYYVMAEDISTGRAGDYSSINVVDINTMEQVAEWRNRVPHSFLYPITLSIAQYYNRAFIAIETNSTEEVVNKLLEGGYDNIYNREQGRKLIPGWYTDTRTRPLLVSNLQDIIMKNKTTIYSGRLISELKTFIWMNGKAQASKKCNDDLVFAFMISDFVIESYVSQQSIGIEIKRFADKSDIKNLPIPIMDNETIALEGQEILDQFKETNENSMLSPAEIKDKYEIDDSNFGWIGYSSTNKEKKE